jgi:glycosyltransferase involved in cell wall biosynthesis
MKILFLNRFAAAGGAAVAMARLAGSLRARGLEVVVGSPEAGNPAEPLLRLGRFERLLGKVGWKIGLDHLHCLSTRRFVRSDFLGGFDLVHLHNLHSGWFNYRALPGLSARKPLVWTLHDMWAFTGHCAYSHECERWRGGCGQCPYLTDYPYMARDASRLEWWLKRQAHSRSRYHVVAPSQWLARLARESILLPQTVNAIPYGIDHESWRPIPVAEARQALGLPGGKKICLVIASDLKERRKGGALLLEALGHLDEAARRSLLLLTAGAGPGDALAASGVETRHLGYLKEDVDKRRAYSASDLMLFTSMADNLPVVILEAMGCALPVLAFNVGGVPDMVVDGETGGLVEPFSTRAYAERMSRLLADAPGLARMRDFSRRRLESKFGAQAEAAAYERVYQAALATHATLAA